jgi:hypothetical protein
MVGPCLCGDPYCGSCGPAQGIFPCEENEEECPQCGYDLDPTDDGSVVCRRCDWIPGGG